MIIGSPRVTEFPAADPPVTDIEGKLPTVAGTSSSPVYSASEKALEREKILLAVRRAITHRGLSVSAACKEHKVSRSQFSRWEKRYDAEGVEGLEDAYENCGRDPIVTLNEAELQAARGLYVQMRSVTAALRVLATRPECRPKVADAILQERASKHTITRTLRDQVAAVPEAVLDWHRSPKKVSREQFINPRTLSYIGKDGKEHRILPGMLAERDDMSNNFLFWVDWPWGGDACSDKYGVRLARGQNLLHIDVGSLRFLSFDLLVRLRDSYRADDIWQWVGSTYRDIGIPEIGERWERGIWLSNKLHGVAIDPGHTDFEARVGGVRALGRRIITSHSPTTKIIENRFRYLQRVCADIPGQIGATRGEMEQVNKLWTQCRNGQRDPRDYFPSYAQACAALETKLQWVNAEMVEGSIYRGVPNDIWVREGGAERMTPLTAEQTYLFSRDQRRATVTKGHALVRKNSPDGKRQAWWFYCEGLWRYEGRKVALFLDDLSAEAGATAVLAEGRGAGTVIGHCELVDGTPQFALSMPEDSGDMRGPDALARRKEFTDAVRSEYRALGLRHTIAKASRTNTPTRRTELARTSPEMPAPRSAAVTAYDEEAELQAIADAEERMTRRGLILPS